MTVLKNQWPNGWKLFLLCFAGLTARVLYDWSLAETADPAQVYNLIRTSVVVSVPWLYLAFGASSLVYLFPGSVSRWIMKNRRMFGLLFAAAMMWQLFFILWVMIEFRGYYLEESYTIYGLTEQLVGYVFIFALGITSFHPVRKAMSGKTWRWLHKVGIYVLWFIIWSTYFNEVFYYDGPDMIDYFYAGIGFGVWLMRVWTSVSKARKKQNPLAMPQKVVSILLVLAGLLMVLGSQQVSDVLQGNLPPEPLGGWLDIFVPGALMVPFVLASWIAMSRKPRTTGSAYD